jgi:hypothetical protein
VPSGPPSLDVSIENEWLWLFGLVGVLLGAGVLGVLLDGVVRPTAEIEVRERPDADGDYGTANVTVSRATDGSDFETVHRGTVSASSRVLYHTTRPGTYRVRAELPDRTCERRVSVRRVDDGIEARLRPNSADPWHCDPPLVVSTTESGWA